MKRARISGFEAISGRMTFRATIRSTSRSASLVHGAHATFPEEFENLIAAAKQSPDLQENRVCSGAIRAFWRRAPASGGPRNDGVIARPDLSRLIVRARQGTDYRGIRVLRRCFVSSRRVRIGAKRWHRRKSCARTASGGFSWNTRFVATRRNITHSALRKTSEIDWNSPAPQAWQENSGTGVVAKV